MPGELTPAAGPPAAALERLPTVEPSEPLEWVRQSATVPIQDAPQSLFERSTLTGDWWGLRSSLQRSRVTFAGKSTQFAFALDGGINRTPPEPLGLGNAFSYTGRNEYDAIVELGPTDKELPGRLFVRLEHWYGEFGNVSLRTGTFAPAVVAAGLPPSPEDPGVPLLTNFLWTKPLSDRLEIFAGKRSGVGAFDRDRFAAGDGTQQFVHMALVDNPALLLGMPYSAFTAGFSGTPEWGEVSLFVSDAADHTLDVFATDEMFSKGLILATEVRWDTQYARLPGEFHLGGVWKHVPLTDLRFAEPPPGVYPEPTVPGFPTLEDSYTIYCGFDQYLVRFPEYDRGWGMFGRASISDGNPTPVRYFFSAGLGGYSPWGRQRGDTLGLGWYFVGASSEFGPLPRLIYGPRNGTGVELFYNIQVTPWLNLTPDIQFLRPEASAIADDAIVFGIRLNAIF